MTGLNLLRDGTAKLIEDGYTLPLIDNEGILELIARITELEATIQRVRDARANHPEIPACDRYTEDDTITCGWKRAIEAIDQALEGDPK